MRVAMIVNSFPSISEKFLVDTIVKLVDRNIEVDIYAAVRSSESLVHDLFAKYGLEARTRQVGIPVSCKKRLVKFPIVFLRNFIRKPLAALRALSFRRYQREALNMKTSYFLAAFIGKKYDVIHCQFGQNGLIGAYLKDCGFCGKLVVTFHGSDITVFPKKEHPKVYEYMFSRVDSVTAGTSFTSRLIHSYGCPADIVHVIPAGVLTEHFVYTPYESRQPFLLLSIGRLEEVKGFEYAIRAFSLVEGDFPEARYIIAGAGSEHRKLDDLITELGLNGRVFLVGAKKDAEVLDLYRNATILLMPSIRASNGSEEGQGLVIQEAEISGLPVIGTMTGGIPDGIQDGRTGFLVPEKDPKSIADRIRVLWTNEDLMKSMGSRGRDFAQSRYDMDVLIDRILRLYRK